MSVDWLLCTGDVSVDWLFCTRCMFVDWLFCTGCVSVDWLFCTGYVSVDWLFCTGCMSVDWLFCTEYVSVDWLFSCPLGRSTAMVSLSATREAFRQWAWASSPTWAWWTMTAGPTALSYSTMASECLLYLGLCNGDGTPFSAWLQPKSNFWTWATMDIECPAAQGLSPGHEERKAVRCMSKYSTWSILNLWGCLEVLGKSLVTVLKLELGDHLPRAKASKKDPVLALRSHKNLENTLK